MQLSQNATNARAQVLDLMTALYGLDKTAAWMERNARLLNATLDKVEQGGYESAEHFAATLFLLVNSTGIDAPAPKAKAEPKRRAPKAIEVRDIQDRAYTHHGVTRQPEAMVGHHADVTPRQSVRLHGVDKNRVGGPVAYDRTFEIGGWAEYDSYNLRYLGRIVAIGAKTVTIQPEHRDGKRVLRLAEFSSRNRHFDLDSVRAHNQNESMYI